MTADNWAAAIKRAGIPEHLRSGMRFGSADDESGVVVVVQNGYIRDQITTRLRAVRSYLPDPTVLISFEVGDGFPAPSLQGDSVPPDPPPAPAEVFEAIARALWSTRPRAVWEKEHTGAVDRTPAAVPSPEAIAEFMPDCPPEAIAEAADRLTRAIDVLRSEPHAWTWRLQLGDVVPFVFSGTRPMTATEADAFTEEIRPAVAYPLMLSAPVTIATGHAIWIEARELNTELRHPWAPIILAWQKRPRPWREVHALVLQPKKAKKARQHSGRAAVEVFNRQPGIASKVLYSPLSDASVSVVAIDGVPVVTPAPGARGSELRRLEPPPEDGRNGRLLQPAPRTLAREAVDPVLSVLAHLHLDADLRSPLRSDVAALVGLGCALMGDARFSLDDLGRFLTRQRGGRVKPETIARAQRAMQAGALFVYHGRKAFQMVRAYTDNGDHIIKRADWFDGGKGIGAWRVSGALCRSLWGGAKDGGLRRMVEGIEAALAWSAPDDRRRSRLPMLLTPAHDRKGGPGEDVLLSFEQCIYLSGEPAPTRANRDAVRRRWNGRVDNFIKAGYEVSHDGGPAPAGDTWEIVERKHGGIIVRASAAMCAAAGIALHVDRFEPVTLDRLLFRDR